MADKCRSCGAEIIWIEDQDGTRLPVNKRRVRIYGHCSNEWFYVNKTDGGDPVLVYISHFVTCPNATEHSKK